MAIKSADVLTSSSKDKLKQYIFYLTQRYYESFKAGDVEAYEMAINHLFLIVEEHGDKYVNLQGFICYCMYINANRVFMSDNDEPAFKLDPLFKMDLQDEDVEELPFDIKNIFNKKRIRERYNEKRTHEHVE